jgi:hypothetical protein
MPLHNRIFATALAAAALVGIATPAHAGPPWVSVELPANPMDPTTKGAYLLVHTFHHQIVLQQALEGRAEGLVNGKRQTVTLAFNSTSREFVQALRRNWPTEGAWVLVITAGGHDGSGVTALVGIGVDGQVRSVNVPTEVRNGYTVPRQVTDADVDALLSRMAAADSPSQPVRNLALALGGLLVLPAGLLAFRRRS